ncbi:MAG: GDP-L-fucose synthase [Candidatus Omnitrophota bacterium]|nr:GDP-L-fucose synthase [Candidatus Omnitrophota bacterium]
MNKDSKILIVGHNDIIEQSLLHYFKHNGYGKVFSSSAMALNPTIQTSVYQFFQEQRPEYVFLGSTRSGGIKTNQDNPGEFFYHNCESQNNIVYAAHKFGARKLLYYASSCVYPKDCPQPMKEESLWTGPLEETSEAYAVAKLAGIKLCQSYKKQYGFNAIVMIPATVYGPGSETDIATAHVMGALIGKFSEAIKNRQNEVVIWGSGAPRRDFLFVDDFVDASLFLMNRYDGADVVNAGSGTDVSIKELADMIARFSGFQGECIFDKTKPDGVARKLLDHARITKLGWKPRVGLEEGIKKTLEWYGKG